MKFRLLIYALLLMLLPACSKCQRKEPKITSIDFKLNWSVYGEHAAFFAAYENGYFKQEGLSVNIIPGSGSGSTVKLVSNNVFPIGYADSATLIKLSSDGFLTKSVAVFTQVSPMSLISKKESNLNEWAQIKGKTIGMTVSDASSALFKIILGKLQLNEDDIQILKIATPQGRVKALLEGKVDAFFGYSINEPHKISSKHGIEMNWLPISKLGIRFLSSAIIVNPTFLTQQPDLLTRFVRASQKGLQFTIANPAASAEILGKYSQEFDKETALKMIQNHLPHIKTEFSQDHALGWSSVKDWQRTIDFLKTYYQFRGIVEPMRLFSNEYLSDVK